MTDIENAPVDVPLDMDITRDCASGARHHDVAWKPVAIWLPAPRFSTTSSI